MKRFLCVCILILFAGICLAADPAPIPSDKEYLVQQAVYSICLDKVSTISTPATVTEYVDLMMARDVLRSPGNKALVLGQYAQALREGNDQPVDWTAVTLAQVKTVIEGIWTDVAMQKFGPEPISP